MLLDAFLRLSARERNLGGTPDSTNRGDRVVMEQPPRHSTIIDALHAWREVGQTTGKRVPYPTAMRMHPKTASALEESALEYPYNAASRAPDGRLCIWGVSVDVDVTISVGNFEILPRHNEP
jgi:hypothetical protein